MPSHHPRSSTAASVAHTILRHALALHTYKYFIAALLALALRVVGYTTPTTAGALPHGISARVLYAGALAGAALLVASLARESVLVLVWFGSRGRVPFWNEAQLPPAVRLIAQRVWMGMLLLAGLSAVAVFVNH